MSGNQQPGRGRALFLPTMLGGLVLVFFLVFLVLITGGFFVYFLLILAVAIPLGYLHYTLWGRAMEQHSPRLPDDEAIIVRADEQLRDHQTWTPRS